MRNALGGVGAKIKTNILCSKIFFRKFCLYEITWKHIVEP